MWSQQRSFLPALKKYVSGDSICLSRFLQPSDEYKTGARYSEVRARHSSFSRQIQPD